MELNIVSEQDEAYQNFVDSVRDSETLRKYDGYLKYFLELIPNKMYKERLGYEPKSRNVEDLANAFTQLALANVKDAKGIIFDGMRVDRDIEKISTLIGLVNLSVRDDVFVTISASYDTWIGNPSLVNAVDVIFLKSHQYWQGYSVDDAISVAFDQRENLEQIIQDKQIILEEHGWPSAGSVIQCAEPSTKAQSYFVKEFVERANNESIPYFLFSAYDEPWKPTIEADVSLIVEKSCLKEDVIETNENAEHNWGLFETNRVIKPELSGIILPIIDQHIEKPKMLILKETESSKIISPNIQSNYRNGDVLQADLNNLEEYYQSISIYNDGELVETFDNITIDTKLLLRSNDGIGFNKVTFEVNKQPNDNPLLFLLPNAFAEQETTVFPVEFLILPDGFASCDVSVSCYSVDVDNTQSEFPVWILVFFTLGLIPLFLKRCKKRYGKPVIEKAPTALPV